MFELTDFTEARIASVTNRTEAHGEDRVPAVSVSLEFEFENTRLDLIDPTLRHALYKPKPDAEPELPEIEQTTPVLRSNSIDRVKLITQHEGWTMKLDDNIDAANPMAFGGCKVDNFTVEPKQGGTIILRLRVGTSDVDAERLGYLGVNNGQSVWLQLLKPEKPAPAIDGTPDSFKRDHPGAADSQGSLLDTDADDGQHRGDGLGTFADDMARGSGDSDDEGHREQAELEAGMRESLAAAGVQTKRGRAGKATH